jgi:MoxR-like ATPase
MDKTGVLKIQAAVEQVHVSDTFLAYLQDILEFTRASGTFQFGLSPRAGLSLSRAARAWAYLHGRDHTLPEDLQQMLPWVAGHRLRSSTDLAEFSKDRLMDIFKKVPVPV